MAARGDEPGVEFWCRGCRHVGSRALSADEKRWIRQLRSRHGRRIALGFAVLPLAILVPLAVLSAVRLPHGEGLTGTIALWSFATLLLGLPVAILMVRDHCRASSDLRDDLENDQAWSFEPPPPASRPDDRDADPRRAPALAFALLPSSRRVVDSAVVEASTDREDILEADPHSGIELYAPLSLHVTSRMPEVRFEQRPLSAVERIELNRVRRQLFRPRASTAFAFVAIIALFAVTRLVLEGHGVASPPRWGDVLSTLLAMAICVRTLVRYTRSILLAGRLGRDLATGLVIRVDGAEVPHTEMLPFSRLFWRIAGAPAGWRDRHRAAETLRASL